MALITMICHMKHYSRVMMTKTIRSFRISKSMEFKYCAISKAQLGRDMRCNSKLIIQFKMIMLKRLSLTVCILHHKLLTLCFTTLATTSRKSTSTTTVVAGGGVSTFLLKRVFPIQGSQKSYFPFSGFHSVG